MSGKRRDPYWLTRYAMKHPIRISLEMGAVLGGWVSFLYRSLLVGVIWGLSVFLLFLFLWWPRFGPCRRYVERNLGDL